jgi:hypothetical protein
MMNLKQIFLEIDKVNAEVNIFRFTSRYTDDQRRWECQIKWSDEGEETELVVKKFAPTAPEAIGGAWATFQARANFGVKLRLPGLRGPTAAPKDPPWYGQPDSDERIPF